MQLWLFAGGGRGREFWACGTLLVPGKGSVSPEATPGIPKLGALWPLPFPRDSRQYPETFLMVTPGGEDGATGMSR